MKYYIILLVLLKLYLQDISCNDSILSKFYHKDYKLRDLRTELIRDNEKYINKLELKHFKHNRTTAALNITVNFKVAMKDKIEILVQAYKFLSNEYRRFPMRFQINMQKAFDANVISVHALKNCGNITTLTFEKDVTYYACNFVTDENHLPPLVPNGRYRIDLKYLYLNEEAALIYFYGKVYTPIVYPKN